MILSDLFEASRTSEAPFPLYHGTPNPDFERFSARRGGLGGALGYWFATTIEAAQRFARPRFAGVRPGIKVCRVRIRHPREFQDYAEFLDAARQGAGSPEEQMRRFRRSLIRAGHDGVVIRQSATDDGGLREDWVAFEPEQITCLNTLAADGAGSDHRP